MKTKYIRVLIRIRINDEVGTCLSHPVFLLTVPMWCFFCGSFLLFMFHVCLYYTVLCVPCSLVITCWERVGLLAILCVMFSSYFVTFPYGVSGIGVVLDCIDS